MITHGRARQDFSAKGAPYLPVKSKILAKETTFAPLVARIKRLVHPEPQHTRLQQGRSVIVIGIMSGWLQMEGESYLLIRHLAVSHKGKYRIQNIAY